MTVATKISAARVLAELHAHRDGLRRYGVRRLGLFGSAARGRARPDSDLDFVVDLERETFDDYMGLKFYLEDLFHKDVDLVIIDSIKPALRAGILSEVRYAQGL
ncbi:MAG: nucleotidyltransferase family protein [Elusimicrobiota bacterium]